MGHGLGGVVSVTPAFFSRATRVLSPPRRVLVGHAYRTPRIALMTLDTTSRARLAGGRGWGVGCESRLRSDARSAAGSCAGAPVRLTTSADRSFPNVSTSHERSSPHSGDRSSRWSFVEPAAWKGEQFLGAGLQVSYRGSNRHCPARRRTSTARAVLVRPSGSRAASRRRSARVAS